MSYKKIAFVMGFALMPDALDRGLNLVVPGYPDHAVFHSLLLYAILIPLSFAFCRRSLPYFSIMAMNVAFDVVNVDPRAFLYPAFGWKEPFHGHAMLALLKPAIQWLPAAIRYQFPPGYYLLLEAGGLFLIISILGGKIVNSVADRRVRSGRYREQERSGAAFPEFPRVEKAPGEVGAGPRVSAVKIK